MLNLTHQTHVFLFTEPVHMRKSFRGMCQLTESVMKEDPATGHWFAFFNRCHDRWKPLGWDEQGFWIWYKQLESGKPGLRKRGHPLFDARRSVRSHSPNRNSRHAIVE